MPGNNYNGGSNHFSSRVERLLRDREQRKSNRISHSNEAIDSNGRGSESFEHELYLSEEENARVYSVSKYLEGAAATSAVNEGCERQDGKPSRQRLLVVANRLPVSAIRRGEDSWSLEISAGGLVSALLGVKEFEARWIGWAGVNVPDEVGQKALTKALAEKRCIPVFLDEEIVHQYYNGYCNNILWPVFHYLGLPQEDRLATTRSFQSQFVAYKKANKMFADVVNKHYVEGDVVWCHDYHLMFLPKCLKEYNSKMKVGWFLHTPFPSSEIHRTLPSRSELLHSVLAADLVGFHTYDYARHFVSACTRILGLEGTPEGVEDQGRLTRVAAFPIGIDSDRFIRALESPQVQENIRELAERFKGRKVMLGVDRLDMIKGIPQKILAFEKFLEENPDWRDKVVLLQIAVPTRTDVPEYQKLTSQVHEIVGRINGRFGTLSAVPIHHLDRSLDFHALCALYAITDVALVTSLRDGMNLVSYEFVACQDAKKGVLILSEFAGAAQSLGAGAILVNPWNITEVALSIDQALNMPADEREKRHKHNFAHVTSHTAQEWAETFVSELNDTVVEAKLRTRQVPPLLPSKNAINCYLQSNNRLLILGFNATLTEPVDPPGSRGDQIKEMELKVHPGLKEPLKNFGEYDMWLAAEHGMFLRLTKGEWMTTMPEHLNMEWVDSVKHVLEYFTERTPRSHFEPRDTSLVWNYKYADVEFGRLQARDMLQHLWTGPISNASVDVVQGGRSVEVRAVGVTKGAAIDRILGEIVHSKSMTTPIDYVLCIGHFLTKVSFSYP
ncbi:alpha,alpha-trehalose-phosphate synthase [UDP-forming] 1-like [Fagus crenata]